MNTIRKTAASGERHKAEIHIGADGISGYFESGKSWLILAMIAIPCLTLLALACLLKLF